MTALIKHGMLLQSAHGPLPNVAEMIAGEPIGGSWWNHPASSPGNDDVAAFGQDVGEGGHRHNGSGGRDESLDERVPPRTPTGGVLAAELGRGINRAPPDRPRGSEPTWRVGQLLAW